MPLFLKNKRYEITTKNTIATKNILASSKLKKVKIKTPTRKERQPKNKKFDQSIFANCFFENISYLNKDYLFNLKNAFRHTG